MIWLSAGAKILFLYNMILDMSIVHF